jgi:propanediol dehydratase large subunit
MAENLIAVWLGLECASGNDTRTSESEIRIGAKITPYLLAGSDLICSGFGSIKKYDNSFNASLFNAEEIEDYLVLQRDFEVDGGLRSVDEDEILGIRNRAVEAISAVFKELGLAEVTGDMQRSVVFASGSKETRSFSAGEVTPISDAIRDRGITALDAVKALAKYGFQEEAENMMLMLRQRVSGDYLQTSAIVRDGKVMSAINDPNEYSGPSTGYAMSEARWSKVANIRGLQTRDTVLATEDVGQGTKPQWLFEGAVATQGIDPREVVIGISPAFGEKLHRTTAGHQVSEVLAALLQGITEAGGHPRVVRVRHSADTSFIGLTAARLSGSGFGIGIQAKGTTVLHQAGRMPHLNLELFSNAPLTSLDHYRQLGRNAARRTLGEKPEPVVVEVNGEALSARHHVRVALLYAIETEMVMPQAPPIEVSVGPHSEVRS